MMDPVTVISKLIPITCGSCGVVFGMESNFVEKKKNDKTGWFCPNGHERSFIGKTDDEIKIMALTSLNLELTNRRDQLSQQVQNLKYTLRAQRAAKTKILNRVKNGVCPCCNRTFKDLQNHFRSKHPELLKK